MKKTHIQIALPNANDAQWRQARNERARLLDYIQAHGLTTNKQTVFCRQHAAGDVVIKRGYSKTGITRYAFRNLITCRSVWSCPECAYVQSLVRADRAVNIMRNATASNIGMFFVTLTIQHKYTDGLDVSIEIINKAFKAFQQGSGYRKLKKELGLIAGIRVLEITHNPINGYHPHYHCVFFVQGLIDDNLKKVASELIYERWALVVKRFGGVTSENAFNIQKSYSDSGLSKYISKLAQELTQGINKKSKSVSRTPFSVLSDIVKTNAVNCTCKYFLDKKTETLQLQKLCDICIWKEYDKTMKGKKQLGFISIPELEKQFIKLEDEVDDKDIDSLLYTKLESVVSMPNSTYKIIKINKLAPILLEILETKGVADFCDFMDNYQYTVIDDFGFVEIYKSLRYRLLKTDN